MKELTKFKEVSTFVGMQTELRKPLTRAPKCPYCGGTMVLRPSSDIFQDYDSMLYVCKNYPECDTYCKTEKKKGKYILLSTPANKELRKMRIEAHVFTDILLRNKLFDSMKGVYEMLRSQSKIGSNYVKHIGECREYGCKEIITICIDVLYQNKEKLSYMEKRDVEEWIDDETREKLNSLYDTIENNERIPKYARYIMEKNYYGVVCGVTEHMVFVKLDSGYDCACRIYDTLPEDFILPKKGERCQVRIIGRNCEKQFIKGRIVK